MEVLRGAEALGVVMCFSFTVVKLYSFLAKTWKNSLLNHILNSVGIITVIAMEMQVIFSEGGLLDILKDGKEDTEALIFCYFIVVTECFIVIALTNCFLRILRWPYAFFSSSKKKPDSKADAEKKGADGEGEATDRRKRRGEDGSREEDKHRGEEEVDLPLSFPAQTSAGDGNREEHRRRGKEKEEDVAFSFPGSPRGEYSLSTCPWWWPGSTHKSL